MPSVLVGKRCLVTGAARGLGAAIAKHCALLGATVVATDIDFEFSRERPGSLANFSYARLDVGDERQWDDLLASIGTVDVLVNNAGIYYSGRIEDTPPDVFDRIYRVNQRGTYLGMRAVIPSMKQANRGSIINISSSAGLMGLPTLVAYAGSKFAVRGMTKVAALELSAYNIRVNTVHPGKIDDEAADRAGSSSLSPSRAFPFGRPARASEVCNVVEFLASDASTYCSGGEFVVDGASTAGRLNYPRTVS